MLRASLKAQHRALSAQVRPNVCFSRKASTASSASAGGSFLVVGSAVVAVPAGFCMYKYNTDSRFRQMTDSHLPATVTAKLRNFMQGSVETEPIHFLESHPEMNNMLRVQTLGNAGLPVLQNVNQEGVKMSDAELAALMEKGEQMADADISADDQGNDELRRFDTVTPSADTGDEVNKLKEQVAKLQTMLEQDKAEALKIQSAVQKQEEEDSLKFLQLMREQEAKYEAQFEAAKEQITESLTALARQAQLAQAKTHAQELEQMKAGLTANIQGQIDAALEEQGNELVDQFVQEKDKLALEHVKMMQEDRIKYRADLQQLHSDVQALDAVLTHDSVYKQRSHTVCRISVCVHALEESMNGRSVVPVKQQFAALMAAAKGDPLLEAVLKSVPKKIAEARSSTLAELQERFETVAAQGRVAARTPQGSGLAGQLLAKAIESVSFPDKAMPPADVSSPKDLITRADKCLTKGNLAQAVHELERLRGLPADIVADWVREAKNRLVLEQALSVAKAHAAVLSCSLT